MAGLNQGPLGGSGSSSSQNASSHRRNARPAIARAAGTCIQSELLESRRLMAAADYFKIRAVDGATGRGVPQVDLVMTDGLRLTTDNNGYIAFNRSGYMNVSDTFTIESYGYAKSGGGNTINFTPVLNGSGTVTLARSQIGERLYRATGQNKLDESVNLGVSTNGTNDPLDNTGHVNGQDTQSSVVYKGRLYQFWQDTGIDNDNQGGESGASYRSTGAVSDLPSNGGLAVDVGSNRTYFTKANGDAREMCPANNDDGSLDFGGSGLFWLGSPMVVQDSGGNEKLVAVYAVINGADRAGKTNGFAVFNDAKGYFDYVSSFDTPASGIGANVNGNAVATFGNQKYFIGASAGGLVRVKATYADVTNINSYEAYTPLKPNTTYTDAALFQATTLTASDINKDGGGNVLWTWSNTVKPLGGTTLNTLIGNGWIPRANNPFNYEDRDSAGNYKNFNSIAMAYNPYRRAWTAIAQEYLGNDVWYAEAQSPTGPWNYAKDITTHGRQDRNYTFYNMAQHPEFTKDGQYLYYEGTYTMGYADGGLITDYFASNDLTGYSSQKFRDNINENFGTGAPANTTLPVDNFSMRYTGKLTMPNESGTYTFRVNSDDGFRLYVNNDTTPILDQWNGAAGTYTVNFFSYAGLTLPFKLEYREKTGAASVKLEMANPSTPTTFGVVGTGNSGTFRHDAPVYDDNYNQVEYRIDLSDARFNTMATGTGLTGQYYDNSDFTAFKKTVTNTNINFNWGTGSPDASVGADTFSARYTGTIRPAYSQSYTFYATSDDGVRLWINGQRIIDKWLNQSGTFTSTAITLQAGKNYDIRVDYYENTGGAQLALEWQSTSQARQIVPTSALFAASNGLAAQYFNNKDLTAPVGTAIVGGVDRNLTNGTPGTFDSAYLQNDGTYSVRYSGQVKPDFSGSYTFSTNSDDGVRVYVNGTLLINNWTNHGTTNNTGSITLEAGHLYDIVMEYYNDGFGAVAQLLWSNASQTGGVAKIIDSDHLFAALPPA